MIEFENVSFSYKGNGSGRAREDDLGHKVNASEAGREDPLGDLEGVR
jgi:hypothetical protein